MIKQCLINTYVAYCYAFAKNQRLPVQRLNRNNNARTFYSDKTHRVIIGAADGRIFKSSSFNVSTNTPGHEKKCTESRRRFPRQPEKSITGYWCVMWTGRDSLVQKTLSSWFCRNRMIRNAVSWYFHGVFQTRRLRSVCLELTGNTTAARREDRGN